MTDYESVMQFGCPQVLVEPDQREVHRIAANGSVIECLLARGHRMPTYVYEVILEDGEGGEQFEVSQRMSDEPLTRHPETGVPVRRVFQPPAITGLASMGKAEKSVKDDRKLEQMGFTKYVKSGDGSYEKVCGKGPDTIQK